MQQLESMIGPDEQILWRGKPDKKCFILESIFNGKLPLAIIWGLIDSFFISSLSMGFGSSDMGAIPLFLLGFFAIHLMPVWIYLWGVLSSVKRYKRTFYIITNKAIYISGGSGSNRNQMKPFSDMRSIQIKKGFFDEKLGVGDIVTYCPFHCGQITHYVNRRPVYNDMNIRDISEYQEVYALISRLREEAARNNQQRTDPSFNFSPRPDGSISSQMLNQMQHMQPHMPGQMFEQVRQMQQQILNQQSMQNMQNMQQPTPPPSYGNDPGFPQDSTFGNPDQSFTSDSHFNTPTGDPPEWNPNFAEKNPWD